MNKATAPRLDLSRHQASHGAAPRGRGGWLFENEAAQIVFSFSGTYADARRAALAWCRANSVAALYVCP